MGFSAPIWGLVADRYGRKLMVIRSMFAGAVVLGLMGLATSPWHIFFLRILQGMTTGTVTASVTMVSSVTPAAQLGLSLGILQTALLLGNVIEPLAGGILADWFGYRIPCGIAFVVLMAGTFLVIFGSHERFTPPAGKRENGFKTMRDILRIEGFTVLLAVYFLVYVLGTLITPILPLYIEELSGNGDKAATLTGIVVGVGGLFSGISAAYFGRLGDRFGHGRILVFSLIASGVLSLPHESTSELIANKKSWADTEKREEIIAVETLLSAVITAKNKVLLKMNVPENTMNQVISMLPSMKNPTISKLYKSDYYAVETVVDRSAVNQLIPRLRKSGAEDILELAISKIVH